VDQDLKYRVLDALRCGDYVQTEGTLKHVQVEKTESHEGNVTFATTKVEAKHCCLGVVGELAAKKWAGTPLANFFKVEDIPEYETEGKNLCIGGATGKFSIEQLEKLGMHTFVQRILIALNDGGVTFDQISRIFSDLVELGDIATRKETEIGRLCDRIAVLQEQLD